VEDRGEEGGGRGMGRSDRGVLNGGGRTEGEKSNSRGGVARGRVVRSSCAKCSRGEIGRNDG